MIFKLEATAYGRSQPHAIDNSPVMLTEIPAVDTFIVHSPQDGEYLLLRITQVVVLSTDLSLTFGITGLLTVIVLPFDIDDMNSPISSRINPGQTITKSRRVQSDRHA